MSVQAPSLIVSFHHSVDMSVLFPATRYRYRRADALHRLSRTFATHTDNTSGPLRLQRLFPRGRAMWWRFLPSGGRKSPVEQDREGDRDRQMELAKPGRGTFHGNTLPKGQPSSSLSPRPWNTGQPPLHLTRKAAIIIDCSALYRRWCRERCPGGVTGEGCWLGPVEHPSR